MLFLNLYAVWSYFESCCYLTCSGSYCCLLPVLHPAVICFFGILLLSGPILIMMLSGPVLNPIQFGPVLNPAVVWSWFLILLLSSSGLNPIFVSGPVWTLLLFVQVLNPCCLFLLLILRLSGPVLNPCCLFLLLILRLSGPVLNPAVVCSVCLVWRCSLFNSDHSVLDSFHYFTPPSPSSPHRPCRISPDPNLTSPFFLAVKLKGFQNFPLTSFSDKKNLMIIPKL